MTRLCHFNLLGKGSQIHTIVIAFFQLNFYEIDVDWKNDVIFIKLKCVILYFSLTMTAQVIIYLVGRHPFTEVEP